MADPRTPHVIVIGAGFCGLTAAYDLAKRRIRVTVMERESDVGGLAGSFKVGDTRLEKFYHYWFSSDIHVVDLIREMGLADQVVLKPSRTGMYYANTFFRLSTPFDLLRFTPLSFFDRIRLGLMTLRATRVRDWQALEEISAADWLRKMGGENVYRVVWEPLMRGKFGAEAENVSAVWFWNKLKLRGGSRNQTGGEQLAYFKGGFAALAESVAEEIRAYGGDVQVGRPVDRLLTEDGRICGVITGSTTVRADAVIATPALPVVADLVAPFADPSYVASLKRVRYLANLCLVLELDLSLSETFWINVNEPDFPFVGVIEHTNFEPASTYGGRHICYLSRYLPESDTLWPMANEDVFAFSLPHLQRMFPAFERTWVRQYHVWRARYAQPIVEKNYQQLIPDMKTPVPGLYLATMAQIYPEDRGTNYAVREGRKVATLVAAEVGQ